MNTLTVVQTRRIASEDIMYEVVVPPGTVGLEAVNYISIKFGLDVKAPILHKDNEPNNTAGQVKTYFKGSYKYTVFQAQSYVNHITE